MNDNQEIQIVKECLKGTERSFKALYELYKGYVYTICVRYGIRPIEIKDCMQTIFMEIFDSLKNYNPDKSKFKTWLTSIVINQILNQKRKLKIEFFSIDDPELNVVESSYHIPPDAHLAEMDIHGILSKMPHKYSIVFNLFIIDNYSHSEIAEQLDISEGTSRVLLHRGRVWAMNELKKLFKEEKISHIQN